MFTFTKLKCALTLHPSKSTIEHTKYTSNKACTILTRFDENRILKWSLLFKYLLTLCWTCLKDDCNPGISIDQWNCRTNMTKRALILSGPRIHKNKDTTYMYPVFMSIADARMAIFITTVGPTSHTDWISSLYQKDIGWDKLTLAKILCLYAQAKFTLLQYGTSHVARDRHNHITKCNYVTKSSRAKVSH